MTLVEKEDQLRFDFFAKNNVEPCSSKYKGAIAMDTRVEIRAWCTPVFIRVLFHSTLQTSNLKLPVGKKQ